MMMMMMMMINDARCSQYELTRGNCLHVSFQSSLCYVLEIFFPRCLKHFVNIPIDEIRVVARDRPRLPANCPTGGVTENFTRLSTVGDRAFPTVEMIAPLLCVVH